MQKFIDNIRRTDEYGGRWQVGKDYKAGKGLYKLLSEIIFPHHFLRSRL